MSAFDAGDVLVIGSGVAGANLAARLAQKGIAVTILEAGRRVDREQAVEKYAASDTKSLLSPYADAANDSFAPSPSSYDDAGGPDHFKSTYLRRVGGSTWHWQGHTPRLIPADFRMFSQYGVAADWPIDYDVLEPYYIEAESELGVAGDHAEWNGVHGAYRSGDFPMPRVWPSYADLQVAERLGDYDIDGRRVLVRTIPQARNSRRYQGRPPCAGNSTCIPLCPIGAKYDATVHVALAIRSGVQLLERTVATRLLISSDRSRIEGVEAIRWGEAGPITRTFTARRYVIAAHAIETARLLLVSSLGDDENGRRKGRRQIGRNLMDHPTGQVVGLAPERWFPFRGPPATSGIDEWRDGDERARSAAWKLSLGNDGYGRFRTIDSIVKDWLDHGAIGHALRARIDNEGSRLYRISWATEQLPNDENRLELSSATDALGIPQAKIVYSVDDYSRGAFATIRTAISKIFARIGVTHSEMASNPRDFGGSGHILGTCRMGKDGDVSVVDDTGRVHGIDCLFVVGSSVFPTVGTANPTLTITALALRTAEAIAKEIR
jgi:choline dehydrogenase-like flavoprotein